MEPDVSLRQKSRAMSTLFAFLLCAAIIARGQWV
jgi:hypothetical protein